MKRRAGRSRSRWRNFRAVATVRRSLATPLLRRPAAAVISRGRDTNPEKILKSEWGQGELGWDIDVWEATPIAFRMKRPLPLI